MGAVSISFSDSDITICMAYVPSNSSAELHTDLVNYLSTITALSTPVLILGDFNLPDIDWPTLNSDSPVSNNFCEFVFESTLTQLVESSTHTCGNILDLVLTNSPEYVTLLTVHPQNLQCIASDHSLITFTASFKLPVPSSTIKEVFNFNRGDYHGFNEYLLNCDLNLLYNSSDVEEIWHILRSYIMYGVDLFIPKTRIRTCQFPSWFTPQLRHSLKCLRTIQRKYTKNPTANNFQQLSKAQQSFQSSNIAAKSRYEQDLIYNFSTNNDPKIFQFIGEFTKSHVLPPQLHHNATTADADLDKAELFNQYFYSIFTSSDYCLPDTTHLTVPVNHLDSINLTEQEVIDALNNLNPNKARGIDNIAPVILKNCAFALALPIHHLFTTSLRSGNLLSEWKTHKIIPVFKSGDKTSVANYRPISLLCVISKVLERLVYDKVINTIAPSITPHQFGFQSNASTQQQLLIYFHQLITSREEIDTIYIDFRKAFDSVPHNELLVTLWNIGITDTLWNWFNSYLSTCQIAYL